MHFDKPFRAIDVVCQNDVENHSLFYLSLTIRHYYAYIIDLTLVHFSVFEFAPEGLALICFTLTMGVVASKNCDIFTDKYCCQKTNDVRATYEQVHEKERSVTSLHQWPNCQFMIGNRIMSHFQDGVQ